MSGVMKRTLHYEYDSRPEYRRYRLSDWNTVLTSIGMMLEPSQFIPRDPAGTQLDFDDSFYRIDDMQDNGSDAIYTANNDLTAGSVIGFRLGR